jgi:uncharacterized protein YecA (UPF0149 family)
MAACNVLQHIHSDLAVSTALELLPAEEDGTIEAEVKENRLEREKRRLQEASQRMEQEEQRLKRELYRLESEKTRLTRGKQRLEEQQYKGEEPPPPKTKIGRNDPCPCGSGKKFKKCCMRKQQGGADSFE